MLSNPSKISKYFLYKNEIYPRGGFTYYDDKGVILIGATTNYMIGLTQVRNDLAIIKVASLDRYIPSVPQSNISTVDELLLHAYKALFTPFYGTILKGNKTLAVGVIFSKHVRNNRATYWIYDLEEGVIRRLDIGNTDAIIVDYTPISDPDLNNIIPNLT